MAWTAPITFYDGDPLTAAQLNTFLMENLNASAPGVASAARQLLVSYGKNQITARQWAKTYKSGAVTISSPFPADPDEDSDLGPTVTFEHGGGFRLLYDCTIRRSAGTGYANYSPVIVDGPGELPSHYEIAVRSGSSNITRTGSSCIVQGADPGVTTVTMKYGNSPASGAEATCVYDNRRLTVIPL